MRRFIINRHCTFLLLCLAVFVVGCIQVVQRPHIDDTRISKDRDFKRGLWIRAASMAAPDAVDRIIALSLDLGITDLYAQVAVGGYAYYRSQYLPRSQYLAQKSDVTYDPLNAIIMAAQKHGIRVHAWVNCLLVWSLSTPPDSANHIYYTHPEWFIRDVTGRSMAEYTYEEWMDAGLEGLYLDPAHPGVQDYLKTMCTEIAEQYPVDGVHLDFIRYPGTLWGLPDNDTAALFAGPEGHTARWLTLTRYPGLDFLARWLCWHTWQFNLEKEKNIKRIIRLIHASLSKNAPDCFLTAALFPNPTLARYRFAQNWMDWDTLIRYPVVMSYTPDRSFFETLLDYVLTQRPDAHFGIGILWPNMAAIGYMQYMTAVTRGARGVSFFDFTRIDTLSDFAKLHGIDIQPEDTLTMDTLLISKTISLFEDAAPGKLIQQMHTDPVEVLAFAEYLLSLSLDHAKDLQDMAMSAESFVQYIQQDVAAFHALDSMLFPLPETLVSPSQRLVEYTFIPWDDADTMVTIEQAQAVRTFDYEIMLYPSSIQPLARAAHNAPLNARDLCRTRSGIYVFSVQDINDEDQYIVRGDAAPTALPYFIGRTALLKARMIIHE